MRDLDADSAACVVAGLAPGNLTGAPCDRAIGEKLSPAFEAIKHPLKPVFSRRALMLGDNA